jgi:formylglycine-generating enzyme required for sulfatase activity
VALGAPNLASHTANGDGTVTDRITSLMWQQTPPTATHLWNDAVDYCAKLSLAGLDDWRLPTSIELVSIVDYGQRSPSINGTYFPSTPKGFFWSSTQKVGSTNYPLAVNFIDGNVNTNDTDTGYVRCVR